METRPLRALLGMATFAITCIVAFSLMACTSSQQEQSKENQSTGTSGTKTENATQGGSSTNHMQELTFVTPYYKITLPESWYGTCSFQYSDSYVIQGGNLGVGYTATVSDTKGKTIFSVACFTDNWDPQGMVYTKNLGSPSGLAGNHVALSQSFDVADSGQKTPDKTSEYAQYVTVK